VSFNFRNLVEVFFLSFTKTIDMKPLLLVLAMVFTLALHAQNKTANSQRTVSGTVTTTKSEPLSGVTVKVKGTNSGTSTNAEGKFSITFRSTGKHSLEFSFVGYATKEVALGEQSTVTVQLDESTKTFEDVVVVGYGKQKKSDVTGAVASISKERIENLVRTDVAQLLQGAAPGLNVSAVAAGSNPENGSVILIRGRNSISASNDPLIVLDGIPYNGTLSDINPNDIESIEILKDASSAAIYGSRASNGVILIQTVKADKGKMRVRYDAFYSFQSVANFPHLMNGDEYYEYKKGVTGIGTDDDPAITAAELAVYNSGSYKDWTWKDLVMRKGYTHQHNLSLSGGSDKTTYNVSLSYLGTQGVVIQDQYKRATSRLNITSNLTKWLTLGSNTMLAYANNSGAPPSFVDLFNKSPLAVPFNPDGSVNITPIADDPRKLNPIETLLWNDLKRKYSVSSNNYLNIEVPSVKGLSYRLNTGLQYESSEKNWYRGTNTGKSGALKGESETNNGSKYSYTIENILSYQRQFGKHNVFLTGLFSVEERENKNNILNGEGFPNDFLSWYGTTSANKIRPTFVYFKTDLISQMFRLNYSYASRYLLTATVRRDGYSGFGSNKKYGVFPSLALGWNISNERFFENAKRTINTLKLRVSYGENGNQAINPYQTLSQLGQGNYIDGSTSAPGFIPSTLGTAGLGWEATRSLNLGLDFGILRSKVTGEINVYKNETHGLLLKRAISAVNGVNTVFQNIGKTENQGVEVMVNTNNISNKTFTWTTNFNFAIIKTKIVDLYGDGRDDLSNKWFLGQNIYVNYDYKFTGIWQLPDSTLAKQYGASPGYARYEDLNGNGKYDPEDRQLIGSPEPNFTWGLTNNFKYKDFTLSVFMYGKNGVRKANPYKDKSYLIEHDFWTTSNPTNEFWSRASQANRYLGTGNTPSIYDNADFIRIKDITVTYSLPKKLTGRANINNVKLYLTGKNLFTITKWSALDPELDNQRAIPLQREYIVGLNVIF
jgi:TonB-linked SusC/RagA family outer membrane protein